MFSLNNIEKTNVYDVYSVIADHFSSTRFNVWSNIKSFLDSFNKYDTIVELGCGNGKNLI